MNDCSCGPRLLHCVLLSVLSYLSVLSSFIFAAHFSEGMQFLFFLTVTQKKGKVALFVGAFVDIKHDVTCLTFAALFLNAL